MLVDLVLVRLFNFYRATCMHRVDYAVARCLSVRPSVCPSVTRQCSVEMAKYIIKVFSPEGSQTILPYCSFFPYETEWQYSDGNLLNGGVECKVV